MQVFHAGTALKDGGVVSSGGRVLTVTAVRSTLEAALQAANQGVATVGFPGAVYRRDIAHRAIAHLNQGRFVQKMAPNQQVFIICSIFHFQSPTGASAIRPVEWTSLLGTSWWR